MIDRKKLAGLALTLLVAAACRAQPAATGEKVLALGFTADGKELAVVGLPPKHPGRLGVWDLSLRKMTALEEDLGGAETAVFGPKARNVAIGDRNGAIKLYDFKSRWSDVMGHGGELLTLAFSRGGALLISGGADKKVLLRETTGPLQRHEYRGHKHPVTAAAFFNSAKRIASGGRDGSVILFDVATGEKKLLRGHTDAIEGIAVSPDDRFVATTSRDGTVRVWDADSGNELKTLSDAPGSPKDRTWHAVAFSPVSPLIAVGAGDGSVHLWGVSTWSSAGVLRGHASPVSAVVFSADGQMLGSGGSDAGVKLWDVPAAREIATLVPPPATTIAAPPVEKKAAAVPDPVLPNEYHQSFGDSWKVASPWKVIGPDGPAVMSPDPRGIRFTLPSRRKQPDQVGLSLSGRVRGNFEITAGYEILHADHPREGHGVGFEIEIGTDTPTREMLGFLRANRVNEGESYVISRITTEAGRRQYRLSFHPTAAKSGSLRLARSGNEVILSASEAPSSEFREVGRSLLGAEDVTLLRLCAYPGHAQNALDLLIKDVRIHSLGGASPSPVASADAPGATAAPQDSPRRGWLGAVAVIALLLLLVAGGTWLYLRSQRSSAAPSPGPSAPPLKDAAIQFPCTGCSKPLRARAELSGKKIKCPQCGQVVSVVSKAPRHPATEPK